MAQVIAYLDCHSGLSGNMFLGAMLDAGLELDTLKHALSGLPLSGYELQLERFQDKGIQGARFDVVLREHLQQTRHLSDIVALLEASKLSSRVRKMAIAVFSRLAEAEAAVHGTSIEEVHFHEVGAVDAIVDITGAAIAVEAMGITQLYASPLPMSSGHVQTSHGLLPVPAPATLEILSRVGAPWKPCPIEGELVTPTGAAILAALAQFSMPAMAIERVGYGFGHKQFPWPNCLRVCLGKSYGAAQDEGGSADSDWVTVIATNIDNMTGELLGGLMDRLLAMGALDVSYIPMQMKKNRPAVMLTVICRIEETDAMAQLLLSQTSTLGVRIQQVERLKAQRSQQQIETPVGTVMVKVKRLGSRIISASPEYEDCRRVASERGISLEEVYDLARQAIERELLK
jgi:pyridinium-3,5-bisthiocarboxylic acid mononucleotide nickel chelatase